MKTRAGFVSNSSSSSFIVSLDDVSSRQLELIKNHHLVMGDEYGISVWDSHDEWDITVTRNHVKGTTMMDNFDMERYLKAIGISGDVVEWSDWDDWDL